MILYLVIVSDKHTDDEYHAHSSIEGAHTRVNACLVDLITTYQRAPETIKISPSARSEGWRFLADDPLGVWQAAIREIEVSE